MLSNPPHASPAHSRQRQHRRQNSTPSAFEAVKIAPLPTFNQQQRPSHMSHRRGLSLDTRRQQIPTARQEYTTLQHGLREQPPQPQQQRRMHRPTLSQSSFSSDIYPQQLHDSEGFLVSPNVTPQSQRFVDALASSAPMGDMSGISYDAYLGSMGMIKNQANFATNNSINPSQEFEFYGQDSALSTPTFLTFPDSSPASTAQGWISESDTASTHMRRNSRRISNGIVDKVAKFESIGNGVDLGNSRPITPQNQFINESTPTVPTTVPPHRPSRFSDDYDESMEETIKPIRGNKSNNRASGIFQELRQQAEGMMQTPPPPRGNTMPMSMMDQVLPTPEFMNMNNVSAEFVKIEHGYSMGPGPLDMTSAPPAIPGHMITAGSQNLFDNRPDYLHHPTLAEIESHRSLLPPGSPAPSSEANSRQGTRHRRTESIASIASAASIADINIEETKTDTGVTLDDITAYIQGPDPSDGKWVCLYEECGKRFGRKENIKSHVQTHLNDRQYQCPSCQKCFVRQHDLKRHAKIHTGIKPYPCECGNSFARHDALTRHRQRGMCIGAFDGIVRKVVKRGRPKKVRPDVEERRDKIERTRRKNKHTSSSSVSSFSGYSDSSAANSPGNDFEGLLDDEQFPNLMEMPMPGMASSATMNPGMLGVSTAPMPTICGSMTEPPHISRARSPSAFSNYSHASHTSHVSEANVEATSAGSEYLHSKHNPGSPAKSVASHYTHPAGTPPELSSSSSPPPTSTSTRFNFDLQDPNTSGISDTSIGIGTTLAARAAMESVNCGPSNSCLPNMMAMENDMLMSFGDDSGLVPMDPHQNMILSKFDEEYDAVNMFTNNDDVFFTGS
ncbi:metallothionein expression activator [Podospora fimiseda]|uniref:C2H2 type master regulator of conidiophore development brlA n=1 Tax=Podospora fimiseda TaxID=252190 RepID=A0AAN6YR34_9PEZI|nr:metallothionein expression activator [Podospora fimiseda]